MNNKLKILNNPLDFTLMACGFFCTSPVLAIIVGGHVLSIYSIMFAASMVLMLARALLERRIILSFNCEKRLFISWIIASCISCVFGMAYYYDYEKVWFDNTVSYLLKTLVYLAFIVLIFLTCSNSECILRGLKYGSIINLIWVIIDAAYYYIFGASLTNQIFSKYIVASQVRHGSIDTFDGGLIRPGGFNTDPASVGLFAPFILLVGLIEKRIWMIILALLSVVFSGSNTSMVCCGLCVILYMILFGIVKKKFSLKTTISLIVAIIVVIILGFRYSGMILDRIVRISDRFKTVYMSGNSENIRIVYVTELPQVIYNQGLKFITGTGFNSASDGYLYGNIMQAGLNLRAHLPFDVENLYISYLLDNGPFGFSIFIIMLIRMFDKTKTLSTKFRSQEGVIAFASLTAVILSSVFYHYTLYSFHILMWSAICIIPNWKKDGVLKQPCM